MTSPPTPTETPPADEVRLWLPLPPPMGNARRHWRATLKAKKAYWGALDMRKAAKLLPAPPRQPFVRATARARLHVWNLHDADNAVSRLKHALDWLVGNGYLADDGPRFLVWDGMPEQVIDRKQQGVELTLRRVA